MLFVDWIYKHSMVAYNKLLSVPIFMLLYCWWISFRQVLSLLVKCRERFYWDSIVVWEIKRSILATQILTKTLKIKKTNMKYISKTVLDLGGSCQYWLAFDTNRAGPSTMSCDAMIRLTTSPSTSSCFCIFYSYRRDS